MDLPISKKLDGLGLTSNWLAEIDKRKIALNSLLSDYCLGSFKKTLIDKGELLDNLLEKCIPFRQIYMESVRYIKLMLKPCPI